MNTNRYKYLNDRDPETGRPRHMHTLDTIALNGTSTVTGVIAKQLSWWASGMAVGKFGWVPGKKKIDGKYVVVNTPEQRLKSADQALAKIQELSPTSYLDLLDDAYCAHNEYKDKRAKIGTDRHALLEEYVKMCIKTGGGPLVAEADDEKSVHDFAMWSMAHVDEFLFSEGHCYSEDLWLGGIVDAGAKLKDGRTAVFDFKSSDKAYDNHWVQIGLYDLQINENGILTADGDPVLPAMKADVYMVVPFGAKEFTVVERTDIGGIQKAAKNCLELYKFTQDSVRTN